MRSPSVKLLLGIILIALSSAFIFDYTVHHAHAQTQPRLGDPACGILTVYESPLDPMASPLKHDGDLIFVGFVSHFSNHEIVRKSEGWICRAHWKEMAEAEY